MKIEKLRLGIGFDLHPFKKGKPLYLGGVLVPFHSGLEGHSDGDCLLHSISDAILGAIAKGSIGDIFPSDDPSIKDISSIEILKKIIEIMKNEGFNIINIDSVVIAEEPELKNFIEKMKKKISETTGVEEKKIGLKVKRTEKLFPSNGIYAMSVCLLKSKL